MTSPEQPQNSINIPGKDGDWEFLTKALVSAAIMNSGESPELVKLPVINMRNNQPSGFITMLYAANSHGNGQIDIQDSPVIASVHYGDGLFRLNYMTTRFDPTRMSIKNLEQSIMTNRLQERRN